MCVYMTAEQFHDKNIHTKKMLHFVKYKTQYDGHVWQYTTVHMYLWHDINIDVSFFWCVLKHWYSLLAHSNELLTTKYTVVALFMNIVESGSPSSSSLEEEDILASYQGHVEGLGMRLGGYVGLCFD